MSRDFSAWTLAVRRQATAASIELPADVIEEIAAHVEDIYLAALADGQTESQANELALTALERATLTELRDRRRASTERQSSLAAVGTNGGGLQGTWFDFRYAARVLMRSPVFAAALIGILAFSIGTTTATFGVVQAVLLRPLPYPAPENLVLLTRIDRNGRPGQISSADWLDYSTRVRAFERVTAYANWTHNLSGDGEPLRLRTVITTGNFFAVLGSSAAIGRVYAEADDTPGATPVVVLSDGFWWRRFGRDPSIIGRMLMLNGRAMRVVGVMPRTFEYPAANVDLWMPIGMSAELQADRASEWLRSVARVRNGVSLDAARSEAEALSVALATAYPRTNSDERAELVPLLEHTVGEVRPALLMVSGAVAFVFLIACLNAASLLLARASVRHAEMAVRLAVGASTWRLVRQVLAESAVLTVMAAAGGLAIGWLFLRGFARLAAESVPRIADATLAGVSVAAAAAASGAIVATCGIAVALALRHQPGAPLTQVGVRLVRSQGLRPLLLTAQIALSFVLVTASLLLAGSYVRLQQVPTGFDAADVLSLRVTLPLQKYPDNAAHVRFADAIVNELSAVPGMSSVGVVNDLPLGGNQMSFAVVTEIANSSSATPPRATVRVASPGYFDALRIPLVSGRALTNDDRAGREHVVLVNRAAADQFWSGTAVGQRVQIGSAAEWWRVVGVVGDIRHAGFQEPEGPVVYIPYAQKPFDFVNWIGILVRAPSVNELITSVKARIAAVDETQPVYDVMLLEEYVKRAQAPFRLNSWIVGVLAALSLVLAVAGVFALTAYNASARRQEYGIRLALGSSGGAVVRLVLASSMRFVIIGIVAGAIGAYVAAQALATLLFEMLPHDPRVFVAVATLLLLAATAAAFPAALRAGRLDPATTIRCD